MICLEGMGGFTVLYSGYIKVSLQILQFLAYQEDVLMLVILDSKYTYRVPLQLGTRVIGNIVQHIGPNNLAQTWRNAFLSTRMVQTLVQRQADNSPFNLSLVDRPFVATQEIFLGPFETWNTKGTTRVGKVIDEPFGELLANRVVVANTYGEMKLGLGRVSICLHYLTAG